MTDLRARVAAARTANNFDALVAEIPYARFLGVSASVDASGVLAEMPFAQTNVGNPALPALHGGAIAGLLELVGALELIWRGDAAVLPTLVATTCEYLRSGRPITTFARAEVIRRGRRVANVRARAWQGDEGVPIAMASLAWLVPVDSGQ